jgi:hypothetical protein
MSTPIVMYGETILGGSSLFDWEWRSGTAPVERAFTVTASRADALAGLLGKASTFTIQGPRKTLTASEVYLIEIQPGDDPFTKRIRLADRRWLWPKTWVMATLNLRRTNGNRFLVGEGRIENKLIQPQIKYARFSLHPPENPGAPWKAKEALRYLIEDLLETPLVFDDEPTEIDIQDLDIDDHGAAAVERLLAYLPGMDVYIDAEGKAHVFNVHSGREAQIRQKLPPLHRDGGWVGVVDRRGVRPKKVVVLFTPEAEMRLEYQEPTSDGSQTRSEDEPDLENIAPIPDATLTVDGEELARSSWVEMQKLFNTWGAFGIHSKVITFDLLRKYALKLGWASFEQAWGNDPLLPPDAVKIARAATAAQHWRKTFRLDRYWVQRLRSIRPYRTAIVNPDTGAFAPATVYSDWIRRPSYKGYAKTSDANTNQGWAVRGYPESGELADAEPAPARVDVIDEMAGIITITPQVDPYGLTQAMLLGYPEDGSIPSQALGDANRTGQELYARWDKVVLEDSWKMAIVLTVVPASPNNIDRAFKVEIDPSQIDPSPGPCEGPVVYARVFPGVMTARFAWKDDQAEGIKAAIKGEGSWPSDLLVNPEFVQDTALAAAERVYDTLRDRPMGQPSFDMDPAIYPAGTVTAVRHTMSGGETTTSLIFGVLSQPMDIRRYMNASTRKAIDRVLSSPGSG